MEHLILIDDNLVIREVFKIFATQLERKLGIDLRIYTSDNGIQGLGYIFITRPEIVVIDLTLPKYSGKELIDFLAENEQFNRQSKKVIALYDSDLNIPQLPENYVLLDKRQANFLDYLFIEVIKGIIKSKYLNNNLKLKSRMRIFGSMAIKFAEWSDKTIERIKSSRLIFKPFLYIPWFFFQIMTSINLMILKLFIRKVKDDNIDQNNKDVRSFRVQYYPSLAAVFVAIFIAILQIILYLGSALALLQSTGRGDIDASASWYNSNWEYRKEVVIDNTQVSGSSNLTDFTTLVSITDTDVQTSAQTDADDILFTAADGTTKLDHEIASYNSGTGALTAWVRVPSVSYNVDTSIYMYYGNAGAVNQENVDGAWASTYQGVYHLDETATDEQTSTAHLDSSGNGRNGLQNNNASTTGIVNNGQAFDGTEDWIDTNYKYKYYNADSFTFSAWFNTTSTEGGHILGSGYGFIRTASLIYVYDPAGSEARFCLLDSNANNQCVESDLSVAVDDGNWHHVVGVRDTSSDQIYLYVDGVLRDSETDNSTGDFDRDYDTHLAVRGPDKNDTYEGNIDEAYIASSAFSADHVATEYNNISSPGSFISVGTQETEGAGAVCGNNTVESGETCDDGNTTPGDGCDASCQLEPVCGDGNIDAGETCDDSNTTGGDGCSATCQTEVDWYNLAWTNRKFLTIDNTKVAGSSSHSNFQMLVSLTDADLASTAQSDGDDILFTSADGTTKLDHEIESFNSGTGELVAWVEVPTLLHNSNTVIYMYYGNNIVSSQENITGTWTDYSRVWLFSEGTGSTASDSTGNQNLSLDDSSDWIANGQIGPSFLFEEYEFLNANDATTTTNYQPPTTGTISFWMKLGTYNGAMRLLGNDDAFEIRFTSLNDKIYYDIMFSGTNNTVVTSQTSWNSNTWYYMNLVYDGTNDEWASYIDDTLDNSGTATLNNTSVSNVLYVGSSRNGISNQYFDGELDTLRISTQERSGDWIDTEFANQSSPSTFYSVSGEEDAPPPNNPVYVTTTGSQVSNLEYQKSNQYIGGAFVITTDQASDTLTSVTIRENGTAAGNTDLDNIKMYFQRDTTAPYDCSGVSISTAAAAQYGITDASGFSAVDGSSTFTESISITNTEAICLFTVLDTLQAVNNGETVEIYMVPSADVVLTNGNVATAGTVSLAGTSTVNYDFCLNPYPNGYCYSRSISIDSTKVDSNLSNFPLLFSGTYSYLATDANGGFLTDVGGDDLIFTSDAAGSTQLAHEVESYSGSTGNIQAWIRIPTLSSTSNTTIYMFYKNSSVTLSQEDKEGTWISYFKMVQHMDTTSTSSSALLDSTLNNNNSTAFLRQSALTGKVNGAIQFDGTDDYARFTTSSDFKGSEVSVQAWFKVDAIGKPNIQTIVSKYHTSSPFGTHFLYIDTNNQLKFMFIDTTGDQDIVSGPGIQPGVWYHVVAKYDATSVMRMYVNESSYSATKTGSPYNSNSYLYVAATANDSGFFDGTIDEVRITNNSLTEDYSTASYRNMNAPASFYSIGTASSPNNAPTLSNLTLNNGSDITLNEGTTTSISITGEVTDLDGPVGDVSVTDSRIYRSGVGSSCTVNLSNCYVTPASTSIGNCTGNTCDITVTYNIEYYADPTDIGSTLAAQDWRGYIEVTDTANNVDTDTTPGSTTEINTLVATSLGDDLNYGTVFPGSNTGSTNATVDAYNTGNVTIDLEISGTDQCSDYPTCSGSSIPVSNQQYSTASFTYGAGTALSGTPTTLDLNINKGSGSLDTIYWGIGIPSSLQAGAYQGEITITAIEN